MKTYQFGAILVSICVLSTFAGADVRLPAVFGDHMVLQQKETVTVWGWADPYEEVQVKGSWQWFGGKAVTADEDGTWRVRLKTPKADNEPVTLTIRGNNEIVLNDVLIGEVWVCSGQSNMEYSPAMLGDEQNLKAIEEANCPNIRLFNVVRDTAGTPQADCQGTWQVCSPETVRDFSATGYFFGKKLQEELAIPVGLIASDWGGTPVEAWTSAEALRQFEPFENALSMLSQPDQQAQVFQNRVIEWENKVNEVDPGYVDGWYLPDYDDTDWKTMEQPQEWTGTDLENYDGIVWFRRDTSLPPSWARTDLQLHLGPIDDIDTVWVNGVKIGSELRGWGTPRVYRLPASVLHVGRNTIAVRVIDTGGEGGFRGGDDSMRIGPVGADAKTSATVARTWRYKTAESSGPLPPTPMRLDVSNPHSPTVLYNAMIAPLIPFCIAGAIWYQGESNINDPKLYQDLFPAMITDWRRQWDQGDFPFYFVQIAPFQYTPGDRSQALREAQLMTLSRVPNVGMAVTLDIGHKTDIHPKNKVDVGDRLARWALAKTYGRESIDFSGPLYKSKKYVDNTIHVYFDYVDGGLVAKDGELRNFEIAGIDRTFYPAKAEIVGNSKVVVSSDEVKNPIEVRYGWSNWVEGTLFNKAGLPASSFRTDDWELE